jgi:DNA-binding response OmpR family regulator
MSRPGECFTSEEIIERVWGMYGDYKSLKNVIYRLRQKIELDPSHPRYLFCSPGSGYFIKG